MSVMSSVAYFATVNLINLKEKRICEGKHTLWEEKLKFVVSKCLILLTINITSSCQAYFKKLTNMPFHFFYLKYIFMHLI